MAMIALKNLYEQGKFTESEHSKECVREVQRTGGEVWVIRILTIVAVLFIVGILMVIIVETIKQYKKMWNEISQMFLFGSLSGIAVLGNTIREHLSVNLILLFMFINMGVILLRVYLKKKFEYM